MTQNYWVRYLRLGDSHVSEDNMQAESEVELREQLISRGYTVLAVKTKRLKRTPFSGSAKPKRGRFALFCKEVSTLIRAGMTVVEAVDTLSARERQAGKSTSLAAQLLVELEQGTSLSQALGRLPDAPSVLIAAVRAGERTSDLPQALSDYLRFDTLVEQLRGKVVSAAIYPAMVVTLGMTISLFLMLVVMPNFARMYVNLRSVDGGAASWMIALALWVSSNQAVMLIFVALSSLALVLWISRGTAQRQMLTLVARVPWVRTCADDFRLAMMYQALALMLKGGYPLTEALLVASRSALDRGLELGLQRALRRIEQGGAVSQAFAEAKLCDEIGVRLIAAAERNGDFHLVADVISTMYSERFELFVERLMRIVEPMLLMVVAFVVGAIVVMMYLPVFDMASRLR
jgi:general secretion pathway protein F